MRRFLSLFTMLMLCGVLAFAQSRVVSGKVTDATGSPIPFASVKVKGTPTGVSADANGAYSLKVKEGDILLISGSGYNMAEVPVGKQNILVSILERGKTGDLETVVVTAGGIRRQAKALGYSTAIVTGEELNKARVTNIATGLAAKVSGLQINLINTGVKADTRVTLRGNRSILGNNQALLVVDNIQLPLSYINSLSPNDIENVTVLKGASASALYGSNASNGVIILTTKKGTRGAPQIRISSSVDFEDIAYLPELQNEFGTYGGETPASSFPGSYYLAGQPYFPYVPYENQNYGPRFNGQRVSLGAPIRFYRADGTYKIVQDSTTYSALPNAKKSFFDKGVTTTNNVSYSAGDEKSRFYFSFEDVKIKGVLPKDVNRRNTIRVNGSRQVGILNLDYNIGYTLNHSNTTPGTGVPFKWGSSNLAGGYTGGGSYFQNRPVFWTLINSPAFVDLRNYKNWQGNAYADPDGYFNAYYGNPWWAIDQTRLDEKSNDLLANIKLGVKVAPWLDFQYTAGIARNDYNNKYTQVGYKFADWAIADTLASGNIPSGVKVLSPSEGDALSYNQRLTSDFLASAHKSKGKFDFKFIAGTTLIVNTTRLLSTSATALVVPDLYNISNRLGNAAVGETKEETRLLGIFGDLTIGYKNFAFLHGSLRRDENSILSEANRSYLYPAVDAALVLTDAIPGLKNSVLNFAKLRAAYSQTAQVSIEPYSLQNLYGVGGGFPFGSTPGFTVGNAFANPDIKPEVSTDKEVGIELGFFRDRIHLSGAYYSTLTNNQTIPISISSTTGFTTAFVNSGVMSNKGYEADLKLIAVKSKSVTWEIGVNYSYNKNVLESLGFGLSEIPVTNQANASGVATNVANGNSFAIVGLPYPYIKTSDWKRDPQGRIIIDPASGYPTADNTQKGFGTSNPPTKIGINSSVSFKNFTLSTTLDGRFGGVIFNAIGPNLDFTGVSEYSTQSGRQPFVIPNSSYFDAATNSYLPNTSYNTQDGNVSFWAQTWNSVGSNYVNSADFWKLRELTLAYNFPEAVLKNQKLIKGLSMSITGRNLYTNKAKGNVWADPEFANNNGNGTGTTDINQLPTTKHIGFNVNVTF